jgi:hypothetical protein
MCVASPNYQTPTRGWGSPGYTGPRPDNRGYKAASIGKSLRRKAAESSDEEGKSIFNAFALSFENQAKQRRNTLLTGNKNLLGG